MAFTWDNIKINDFPLHTQDIVRFSDIDVVGHVNNLAFVSFIESGRVQFLYTGEVDELTPNSNFVVVQLGVKFRREMNWPGRVDIGSAITHIGNTSIKMAQALFQDGECTAATDSALVLMDRSSRKPTPIPEEVRAILERNLIQIEGEL